LRTSEEEKARVEQAIRDAEGNGNAQVKAWLGALKPADALKLIEGWNAEDGTTVEERRAALAALVERIVFNPANGTGRVHYRIGLNGAGFNLRTADARELAANYAAGAPNRGMMASSRRTAAKPAINFVRKVHLRGFRRAPRSHAESGVTTGQSSRLPHSAQEPT
jgi:hypothetical protein